jgi:hypothetical protein
MPLFAGAFASLLDRHAALGTRATYPLVCTMGPELDSIILKELVSTTGRVILYDNAMTKP